MAKLVIKTVSAEKIDLKILNELICTVFERRLPIQFTEWKYRNYPDGRVFVSSAWDGEKLVGIQSIFPLTIEIKNELLKSSLFMDVGVHPNYRGRGLFAKLVKEAEAFSRDTGSKIVITFPNKNSYSLFFKKLDGWREVKTLKFMIGTSLFCEKSLINTRKKGKISFKHRKDWDNWLIENPVYKAVRNAGKLFGYVASLKGVNVFILLSNTEEIHNGWFKSFWRAMINNRAPLFTYLGSNGNELAQQLARCSLCFDNFGGHDFHMLLKPLDLTASFLKRLVTPENWDISWKDWDISWGG